MQDEIILFIILNSWNPTFVFQKVVSASVQDLSIGEMKGKNPDSCIIPVLFLDFQNIIQCF